MKRKIFIILALIFSMLFATPVFATQNSDRASEIALKLENYQVSAKWKSDLSANAPLLQELVAIVENFDYTDVQQLGSKKESVFEYYKAYCELIGVKAKTQQEITQNTNVNVTETKDAAKILASLLSGNVNPSVSGDIAANAAKIEKMLSLVFNYSESDISKIDEPSQKAMTQYFISYYDYKGWDPKELDLVFTKSLIPLSSIAHGIAKPPQNAAPTINEQANGLQIEKKGSSFAQIITGIAGFLIWVALLVLLTIILKQRSEKNKYTEKF